LPNKKTFILQNDHDGVIFFATFYPKLILHYFAVLSGRAFAFPNIGARPPGGTSGHGLRLRWRNIW
jgi:hypothetical protein